MRVARAARYQSFMVMSLYVEINRYGAYCALSRLICRYAGSAHPIIS